MAKTSPYGIPALLEALERSPELLIPLIREMPPALLKRSPAPGKWSAHQHAVHLADVHPLFVRRLERMLGEDDPEITPYDPTGAGDDERLLAIDLDEALERFRTERAAIVWTLRSLSGEQWNRTARHPQYARYSVFVMFRHLALHDFLHGYRIEELVLRPQWD